MFLSINSAPYLKRVEYDLDDSYADTDPLIADEMNGCVDVRRDSKGSGWVESGVSEEWEGCCECGVC
jgi:hypothetical protein